MRKLAIAFVGGLLAAAPGPAVGSSTGGTLSVSGTRIASVACRTDCAGVRTARPGSLLRLRGAAMRRVRTVTFLGGRGERDDVTEPVAEATPHSVVVRVPAGARAGRLRARNADRTPSPPSTVVLRIAPPTRAASPGPAGNVFPVRGPHGYGDVGARFGAERPGHRHQGQDVVAPCGTPLVAVRGGTVRWQAFQANAGNYIVIAGDTGLDYVYMHLQEPALAGRGAAVSAGQTIGAVGATGRASGCHLHFELWTAPGWFEGGRPLDPLASLRSWEGS
jgi:murein DD-endopeptidase MepM/ murein hydrolase activator NlpD